MDYVAEAKRHANLALHFIATDADREIIKEHINSFTDIWNNGLDDEQRVEVSDHAKQGINTLPIEKRPGADEIFFGVVQPEHVYDNAQELAKEFAAEKELGRTGVLYSYADALNTPSTTEWVVKGLFSPCSVSLVCGAGGSKKTYSMIDLVVAVASGKEWLGFDVSEPTTTLFVDEESGPRRFAHRVCATGRAHEAPADLPLYYISLAGFDLTSTDGQDKLQELINKSGARLVILDALVDIMAGGDENAVSDVQPIFGGLRRIAELTQSAIVVIHHTNRTGEYRGSSALKGAVDIMLMVTSAGNESIITFKTEKARDIEPVTFHAKANFGDGTFNLSPAAGTAKSDLVQPLVLSWLNGGDRLNQSELVERGKDVGTGRNSILKALRMLEKSGEITISKDGVSSFYSIV